MKTINIEENPFSRFIFSSTRMSWFWLIIRVYVGWQWLEAGWGKLHSPAWIGDSAGSALTSFINGALTKTGGAHPDVQGWYASFLSGTVLPHVSAWAHAIAWGETLVGFALIIGALTGIAAFFGLFMNLNFLMAGTISINPILFVISIGIILAWRVAGYIGVDHFLLPILGTPWRKGRAFEDGN